MSKIDFASIFLIFTLTQILYVNTQTFSLHRSEAQWEKSLMAESKSKNNESSKTSLFPLRSSEIIGLVLIVIVAGLANSSGIGGGTLLMSILIIFFYYTENQALAIVYSLVFGGALGNYINTVGRRSSKTGKPLINYDLALICMPLMLMGTTIGVILGRIAAPILIVVGVVIVTTYTTVKVYTKAKKQYVEESTINHDVWTIDHHYVTDHDSTKEVHENEDMNDPLLGTEFKYPGGKEQNYKLFPKKKYALMISLILIIILMSLLRGTNKLSSIIGLSFCGIGYWALFVLTLICCGIVFFVNKKFVKNNLEEDRKCSMKYSSKDFELDDTSTHKLTILSSLAGVLAGLLGIGGGMIMNPTLLSLGISTQSVAATSGFFVVQTSFISLFQSLLYLDVPLLEQGFFFLISLIGSFIVSLLLTLLVKRTRHASYVLFALIFVLVLSIIVTPAFEIWLYWSNLGKLLEFHSIC